MVSQNELLTLHLTCPEDSPLGGALRHLFYSNPNLLGMIENAGSPHSGGQHRLVVYGKRKDLVSWVELFVEEYVPSLVSLKRWNIWSYRVLTTRQ